MSALKQISQELKSESSTAIVAGFGFASAIAWMDVVRWLLSSVVNVKQNGGSYYLLTALFTTILAVIVIMIVQRIIGPVKRQPPVYAVSK